MINDLQSQSQTSTREVSRAVGLGYRTVLRWKKRVSGGQPPLTSPGPKKTGPLPLDDQPIAAPGRGPTEARPSGHPVAWSRLGGLPGTADGSGATRPPCRFRPPKAILLQVEFRRTALWPWFRPETTPRTNCNHPTA